MDAEKTEMPEEQNPSAFHANKFLLAVVLLLAAVIAVLLPSYLKHRIGRFAETNVFFELNDLYTVGQGTSADYVFSACVRNKGTVSFDQVEGDLAIYVHNRLVYECHCTMSGLTEPESGQIKQYDFGIKDVSDPNSLHAIGPMDRKYVWTLTFVRWVTEDGMKHGIFYNQDKR